MLGMSPSGADPSTIPCLRDGWGSISLTPEKCTSFGFGQAEELVPELKKLDSLVDEVSRARDRPPSPALRSLVLVNPVWPFLLPVLLAARLAKVVADALSKRPATSVPDEARGAPR
jgi:hypothetical protein